MSIPFLLNKGKQTLRRSSLVTSLAQPTTNADENQFIGLAPIAESPVQDPDPHNNLNAASGVESPKNVVPGQPVPDTLQPNGPTTSKNVRIMTTLVDPVKQQDGRPDKGPGAGENHKSQPNAIENLQAKFAPSKRSRVWDVYVKKTEEEDKDLVEDWDRIIDVTLVFAALFSAISTGFVLESSKNLQADPGKETVLAIRDLTSIVQAGLNASSGVPLSSIPSLSPDGSFKPTITTIWVNCLWFLSLGLSISVSLFAMLAKRWCYIFRSKRVGTSYERALKRQESWDAIEQWKIELVIEQLPTLMHIALMLFFVGLVVYLSEIHQVTMIVTAALVGFTLLVYCVLTVLPLWSRTCPMVTPFTRIISATLWYLFKLNDSTKTRIQSFLDTHADILETLYERFAFERIRILRQMNQRADNTLDMPEWVMVGCRDAIGKTNRLPPPEDAENQYAFRALVWILKNSKERETVKAVLDHVVNFPEVILDSLAPSEQLYAAASTVAEHLNRFQHDAAEWRHTLHFNSLCARIIYLTSRRWLHQSKGNDSSFSKIKELSNTYEQFKETDMSPDELKEQIRAIRDKKIQLADYIPWMEDLAGKIVLGCSPEPGLKICTALGKSLLSQEPAQQAHSLETEVYPTLWWIFLNNVMDCSDFNWPYDSDEYWPEQEVDVTSDSTLTLSHFRDSRKRQENAVWLTVVGISGMLYAFTRYPSHEDGPAKSTNDAYFKRLIKILRSVLHTPVIESSDPFIGELPVHNGTETRLYEFDSVQYGFDALQCAIKSHVYDGSAFLNDLRDLLHDISQLKDLKQLFRPDPDKGLDYAPIEEYYEGDLKTNRNSHIWLASGVLRSVYASNYTLDQQRTKFLSRLLPDLIFGVPGPSVAPSNLDGYTEIAPTAVLEKYVKASDVIATWAWMPFRYDSQAFRADFKAANPNCTHYNVIWELLCKAGLLQIPLDYMSTWLFEWSNGVLGPALPHALGNCLYIKASLLERLYSFPGTGDGSPDIVQWSIALSKHIVALLRMIDHWENADMNPNEQAGFITSLMQLVNTLLDIAGQNAGQQATESNQDHLSLQMSTNSTAASSQLSALVNAGILTILSHPFSAASSSIGTCDRISDKAQWHNDLARTIDRLARGFFPSGVDSSDANTPYSNLVAYYEAQVDYPSLLKLVQELQNEMIKRRVA